ncbi:MAG: hypothetical protein WBB45_12020 [Cyclobacteriaceae bacterium]
MMKRLIHLLPALLLIFALASFASPEMSTEKVEKDEITERIPELKAWGTVTALHANGDFTFRHCDSGSLSTVDRNGVSLTVGGRPMNLRLVATDLVAPHRHTADDRAIRLKSTY